MPISAGVLPPENAIDLVISVSMKPGVQALTLRFGCFLAKNIVYAFVQALDNPYAGPMLGALSEIISLFLLASMHLSI